MNISGNGSWDFTEKDEDYMKTDLNSLKKDFGRMADLNYLKKELNRIAGEVRKFDVQSHLTPQTKARLEGIETRFRDALDSLKDLQKNLDSNLNRFVSEVRKKAKKMKTSKGAKKAVRKKASKASAPKTTRKTAKKA